MRSRNIIIAIAVLLAIALIPAIVFFVPWPHAPNSIATGSAEPNNITTPFTPTVTSNEPNNITTPFTPTVSSNKPDSTITVLAPTVTSNEPDSTITVLAPTVTSNEPDSTITVLAPTVTASNAVKDKKHTVAKRSAIKNSLFKAGFKAKRAVEDKHEDVKPEKAIEHHSEGDNSGTTKDAVTLPSEHRFYINKHENANFAVNNEEPKIALFMHQLIETLQRTIVTIKNVPVHLAKEKFQTFVLLVPNKDVGKMNIKVIQAHQTGNSHIDLHISFWQVLPESAHPLIGKLLFPSPESNNKEISFHELAAFIHDKKQPAPSADKSNNAAVAQEDKKEDSQNSDNIIDYVVAACNKVFGFQFHAKQHHNKRDADQDDDSQPDNDADAKPRARRAVFYAAGHFGHHGYIGIRPAIGPHYYPGYIGYNPVIAAPYGIYRPIVVKKRSV